MMIKNRRSENKGTGPLIKKLFTLVFLMKPYPNPLSPLTPHLFNVLVQIHRFNCGAAMTAHKLPLKV